MSPKQRLPLTVEIGLLGFLCDGPLHGYEVNRRLEDPVGLGSVWKLRQSHLYGLLARMEADGYLASTTMPQASHPPRRLYALTPAGQAAFCNWLRTPVAHPRDLRLEFLVKLYFAERAEPAVLADLIQRQRLACQAWLEWQADQAAATPEHQAYRRQVSLYRRGQLAAVLAWLNGCEPASALVVPVT